MPGRRMELRTFWVFRVFGGETRGLTKRNGAGILVARAIPESLPEAITGSR
jgi:hypothetical protein